MSFTAHPSIRKLLHPSRFRQFRNRMDRPEVAKLPIEYQKFYTEWMESEEKETPVHWIPKEGKWERNPETGEVKQVQNTPIPVNYPKEMHDGLWGGEGVIQGTVKKGKWRSPVPRYWSPTLFRSVVYSEILDTYFSVTVTARALRLIDEHHGLDNYLLTTPAYDLKSLLALKIKRKIMMTLLDRDFFHNDLERQQQTLAKYSEYLLPRKDLEWYGLSVDEAVEQARLMKESMKISVPLKMQYRAELIEELMQENESSQVSQIQDGQVAQPATTESSSSWMSKLNPFAKRQE